MAEVLAFDPHRARTYLHGLRGEAHIYAWHYFRWRTGKRKGNPRRPREVSEVLAATIRDAVNIGLGRKRGARAPAKFVGWQERPGGKPAVALYNLTEAIPGHPKGSTVSHQTLVRAGFVLPRTPAQNPRGDQGLIWNGRRRKKRKSNPPRRTRAGGGARLIYPEGRIVGTWYGRHKNGKLYKHRFGRGLKSVYGLPGGDLILSAHKGRLWKTIF